MVDDPKTQVMTESRKPLWVYFKQSVAHLWLGICALWPIWVVIFSLVAIWIILVRFGCGENYFRLLGTALQISGVITVAIRLRGAERLFEKPTIRERVSTYFKNFPRRRVANQIIAAQGISMTASAGKAKISIVPGPDTPLKRRVEILEEETKNLLGLVEKLETNLGAQSKELTLKIKEEIAERKAAHRNFEEQLERALIGDIHIDWWGVIFFIIGIILAGLSPEISDLLSGSGFCEK